jgi:hypothetical protein
MIGETQTEKVIRREMGLEKDSKPWAQFFDSAMIDHELSEAGTRKRYKNVVFIEKIPTADGLVVRDKFHRKMREADKAEFPEAWAAYEERKEAQSGRGPNIRTIPCIDAAIVAELVELRIATCRDLIEYEGDLEELEPLRDVAQKVMEVADGSVLQGEEIRKRREALRRAVERPKNSAHSGAAPRAGLKLVDRGPEPITVPAGKGDAVETFSYSFEA